MDEIYKYLGITKLLLTFARISITREAIVTLTRVAALTIKALAIFITFIGFAVQAFIYVNTFYAISLPACLTGDISEIRFSTHIQSCILTQSQLGGVSLAYLHCMTTPAKLH